MTRRWLEQAIESDYIPAIRSLDDTPEGRQQAEALNQRIRQEWHDRGSRTLLQQQGLMDLTRRTLKDALGNDHWALNYIKFTAAEYTEINNLKQDRVAERNEATQQIENPDAIVAAAVRLLDSPDWADIAAGLALLTGRRVAELLSTASFEKKTQWSVTFTGALKRRGEPVELAFEIPTLTTADRIIKALSRVRTELPEATQMQPGEINKRYEQAVARACDRAFAKAVPTREGKDNLYSHLFRAVYGCIACFWYCPPSVQETEFKAAIQGHYNILDEENPELRRSLAASRHYSDYEISDQEIARHNGKRKGIKLGVAGIQPIEQFQQAWEKNLKPKGLSERKERTSVRIWHDDKMRLDQLLERFEGNQQQRIHALLDWIESSLPALAKPIATTPAIEAIPMRTQATTEQHTDIQQPEQTLIASTTASKIDQLIETMNRFMEMQMALATTPSQPTFAPKPPKTTRPKVVASTTPDQPSEAPAKPAQTRAKAAETTDRLNQAIDAIMEYNDAPDRKHTEKWAIGINTLKSFAGSQEAIVAAIGGRNRKKEEITGARQAEIEAHHQKHEIDPSRHNYYHRGKQKIEEVIRL